MGAQAPPPSRSSSATGLRLYLAVIFGSDRKQAAAARRGEATPTRMENEDGCKVPTLECGDRASLNYKSFTFFLYFRKIEEIVTDSPSFNDLLEKWVIIV